MPTGYPNKPKIQAGPIAGIDVSALITQVQSIAADYESSAADATKWRQLLEQLAEIGYGPNISPLALASLLPNPGLIAGIASASQVAAAPKRRGPKPSLPPQDWGAGGAGGADPQPANSSGPGDPIPDPAEA